MSVREYIGARYVPLFADPIQWDNTKTYEPLTIVYHQGNSYTSRQAVPTGVAITNDEYWALTGNYNAQIEAYRQEVQQFSGDINDLQDALPIASFDENNTVNDALTSLGTSISDLDTAIDNRIDAIEANGWVTTARLDSNAVTTAKIDDGSVTTAKLASSAVTNDKVANSSIKNSKLAGKYFAVIGDSFSNDEAEWPSIVEDNTEMTLINKAANAAGFVTGSTTFISQLTAIQNDANFEQVEYIVLYGGINDFNDANAAIATMTSAFTAFKTQYLSTAHKPKLIFAFGNIGNAGLAQYNTFKHWYTQLVAVLHEINMPGVVEYVPFWHFGYNPANVFQVDGLHPNTAGQQIIASYILQLIEGTYTGVSFERKSAATTPNVTLSFVNGIITVGFRGFPCTLVVNGGWKTLSEAFVNYILCFGNYTDNTTDQYASKIHEIFYSGTNSEYMIIMYNKQNKTCYVQAKGSNIQTAEFNIDNSIVTSVW